MHLVFIIWSSRFWRELMVLSEPWLYRRHLLRPYWQKQKEPLRTENSGTSTEPNCDSKQYPTTYVSSINPESANRTGITNTTKEKVPRNKTIGSEDQRKVGFYKTRAGIYNNTILFFVRGAERRKVSELFIDAAETWFCIQSSSVTRCSRLFWFCFCG